MEIAERMAGEYFDDASIAVARCSSKRSIAGITVVMLDILDFEKKSVASLNSYREG